MFKTSYTRSAYNRRRHEILVQESSESVNKIRYEMKDSVAVLTSRVDKIHQDSPKQNSVIVGIQREAQHTVNDLVMQFTELKELVKLMHPGTVPTRTSAHWEHETT